MLAVAAAEPAAPAPALAAVPAPAGASFTVSSISAGGRPYGGSAARLKSTKAGSTDTPELVAVRAGVTASGFCMLRTRSSTYRSTDRSM
jgi:hypothetical protein